MSEIRQDIGYALRGLRQRPLFAIVAVLSIAIGVGANATIFSIVNALLLRAPAGIGEPSRVVEVGRTSNGQGFDTFSYPELQAITSDMKSLDRVAGTRDVPLSFQTPSGVGQRLMGMGVSQPYFEVLGTTPFKGRFFAPQEDLTPGTSYIVVVTHAFWKKQLQARADVIGSTIILNRHPFTVIGVTQPDFASHIPLIQTDVYIPLTMFGVAKPEFDQFTSWRSSWLTIVARLAPNTTVNRARGDAATLFARLHAAHPDVYAGNRRSAAVEPLTGVPAAGHGPVTAFLSLLMGLVALVLLTTCANVAGMLIARAAGREREIAIRLALGSGRRRLVRQLLIESVVLFSIGGACGILLCTWGLHALSAVSLPVPVTLHLDFAPDARVFIFGLVISLVTGLLFGLAPALQATRPNLVSSLKNEGAAGHSRGGRMRRIFVVAQVSFSLVLLISAGLFLRSLQRASHVNTGFRADGVQLVRFDLSLDGYDEVRGKEFVRALTTNLSHAAGVSAAAVSSDLPLDMGMSGESAYPEGWTGSDDGMDASFNDISQGYFDALGIRIIAGRAFNANDGPGGARVAVVSEEFAKKAWPGKSAIGKTLRWGDAKGTPKLVVGVAGNVKNKQVMDADDPMVYLPESQEYRPSLTLAVKTRLTGHDAETLIRRQVAALDPSLPITPMQSLEDVTRVGTLPQRIAAMITSTLGILALVLSGMGIYGVIAYMVTQRTREIGVRMAIGAHRGSVIRLVAASALRLALPGVVIGTVAAIGLGRLMGAFILDVTPADPLTFTIVPVVLLLMIGVATCVPAWRAARVSPMTALRSE